MESFRPKIENHAESEVTQNVLSGAKVGTSSDGGKSDRQLLDLKCAGTILFCSQFLVHDVVQGGSRCFYTCQTK